MLLVSSPALADDQAAKVEKTEKDTAKLEEIAATSTGTEKDVAEAPTTANNVAKEEKQEEKTSQTSGGEQVSHLPNCCPRPSGQLAWHRGFCKPGNYRARAVE